MSYDDYIKDLDYEDLTNLMERCKKRQAQLTEAGKVVLYVVSCKSLNHFASTDRQEAVDYLKGVISLLLQKEEMEMIREFHINKINILKSELTNWDDFKEAPSKNVWVK